MNCQIRRFSSVWVVSWLMLTTQLAAQESYPIHPDSIKNSDVPTGTVHAFKFSSQSVYPGTDRDYFVYVPAQYKASEPAALMVFQDGQKYVRETSGWRLPIVFDNLIAAGAMPVTIAVCVNPGVVPGDGDAEQQGSQDRFNRSFEYDTVSDRYARFLTDELLPEVEREYSITSDPNLRGIGGSSSGAIAAFGAAWHRPDQFRRVFSTVGTFVGLRGGNEFPTLVRKSEPKPIRVFLQDGENDQDIYGGNWWNANLTMLSALKWAGYEVNHEWGKGGHNGKHGAAIFPDAMRWLWKDWDRPITVDYSNHPEMKNRFVPDADWKLISDGHGFAEGPAVAPNGDLYFVDVRAGSIFKVTEPGSANPTVTEFAKLSGASGLMFDSKGRLCCAGNKTKTIVRFDQDGTSEVLASGHACNDLVVVDNGVYFTCPPDNAVYFVAINGDKSSPPLKVAEGITKPNGLTVTPDRRFLLVVDSGGRYVWSYRIEADGELTAGQPYAYLHLPADEVLTGADGAAMTADGSLIVATKLGLQIFDQPGRVHVIASRPTAVGKLTNCVLGGEDLDTLYVTVGGSVYRRKTAMRGVAPWQSPVKPPKPRL